MDEAAIELDLDAGSSRELPPLPTGRLEAVGWRDGKVVAAVNAVLWLEGESTHAPLVYRVGEGPWRTVEGLDSGSLTLVSLRDHFLACTQGYAGLYERRTARRVWHAGTSACPVAWPPPFEPGG